MNDVRRAVVEAWDRLRTTLAHDSTELRRRLARRRGALLRQPPRAWCLAIRATDTRLPDVCALRPSTLGDVSRRPGGVTSGPQGRRDSNVLKNVGISAGADRARQFPGAGGLAHVAHPCQLVTVTSRALRWLCAPVFLDPPGQTIEQVARQLGTTRNGLLHARLSNIFQHHHVAGLGGYHARPRPLLWADVPLDPASRRFLPADRVWADSARELVRRIPPGIAQTLTRVAHYHSTRPLVARPPVDDLDSLHPEDPNRDLPPPRQRNLRLPPPPPDYVWYKWRDGAYVGHDWRSADAVAHHHARDQRLRLAREAKQRRRELRGGESTPGPARPQPPYGTDFRGWRWLCPRCGRKVNLLFYPLPPIDLLPPLPQGIPHSERWKGRGEGGKPGAELRAPAKTSAHDPAPKGCGVPTEAVPGFACERCLRIKRLSRCDKNSWNELVTYLSGGLLYGREVARPAWYRPTRKLAYTPRPTRAPSRRRPQVERLLLAGQPFRAIAQQLGITYGTVLWTAQQVYKQHGVRSLPELLRKHGITPKLKKREEVRRRIAEGQPVARIVREMGISATCVYNHVYMLRRAGTIAPRQQTTRGAAHLR